jgi:hypothetical protein
VHLAPVDCVSCLVGLAACCTLPGWIHAHHTGSLQHASADMLSHPNQPPPAPLPAAQRWPALLLKVYHRAVYVGQDAFVGYALCPLPTTPGLHHVTCDVWAVEDTERSFAQQLKGAWCRHDGSAGQSVRAAAVWIVALYCVQAKAGGVRPGHAVQ